jgi:hypothetical protein
MYLALHYNNNNNNNNYYYYLLLLFFKNCDLRRNVPMPGMLASTS